MCAVALIPFFMLGFDPAVMRWTTDFHNSTPAYAFIDAIKPAMGFISNGATLIASAFLLYLFGRYRNPGVREFGKSLVVSLVSAGLTVQVLKHLIGRARPRLTYDLMFIGPSLKSGYDSFPSGHTTLSFCFAYIVSQYYPRYRAAAYFFAVLVGLYRVDGLSHFPSDVLAGAIVGTLAAKLIYSSITRSAATA